MVTNPVGASGLDVISIVGQLMTIEKRPLNALAQKQAQATSRIAALSRVQGAVSALQTASGLLAKSTTWTSERSRVTGDGVAAAVTDSNLSVPGAYSLKVTQLAAAQALVSAEGLFAGPDDVVGTGTLSLQVGSGEAATITIDTTNNTLAGLRDAINAAKAGVAAAIVNVGGQVRLTLTATDSGASNTIALSVTDSDGNDVDLSGLSRLSGTNLLQARAAADARFEINGLALTSPSNKVTGAIAGVTLDLRQASTDAVTTVNVERDTAAIRSALDAFIKAYNDLDKIIRDLTAYDPANRTGAVLNGDSAVRSLQSQVRGLLRGQMTPANAGDFSTLSEIGIEIGRDGSLSLNAAKFEAASGDPEKLSRLFMSTSSTDESARGFGARLESFTKSIVDSEGLLTGRTRGLQAQIDAIKKQEERLNARLDQIEQRLRRQYSQLDALLTTGQTQSNALANALAALPATQRK